MVDINITEAYYLSRLLELKSSFFNTKEHTQYEILHHIEPNYSGGLVYRFFKKIVDNGCITKTSSNKYLINEKIVLQFFEDSGFSHGLTWDEFLNKVKYIKNR